MTQKSLRLGENFVAERYIVLEWRSESKKKKKKRILSVGVRVVKFLVYKDAKGKAKTLVCQANDKTYEKFI